MGAHQYYWTGSAWAKVTANGGGGAVTIADGADVTQGAIGDAAVQDAVGTVNAHVRGITKTLLAGIGVTLNAETTKVIGTVNQGTSPWVTNDPGIPNALGQSNAAGSTSVVLASDQSSVPVAATLSAETTKVLGVVRVADGSGSLLVADNNGIDGVNQAIALKVRGFNMAYNGSSWDRVKSNTTGAWVAAGATSTQSAIALTSYNARGLVALVNVSAASGGGTVTVAISGKSTTYTYPLLTSAALGSVAVTPLRIFPGATASPNAVASDVIPRDLVLTATVSGTVTFGIDYILTV